MVATCDLYFPNSEPPALWVMTVMTVLLVVNMQIDTSR